MARKTPVKFAVVGASKNREKYGNKVLRHLVALNESVVAINPHEKTVEGVDCYASLSEAPIVDTVVFVVPPKVTLRILEEVKALGITHVWMQPGSESDEAVKFCRKNNIECTLACIMASR